MVRNENLKLKTIGKFKMFYRPGTADEINVNSWSFDYNKSVDPFYRVRERDQIVVIGAHIGFHEIFFANRAFAGQVFAIEPESCNFFILKKNIAINNLKNIVCDRMVISKSSGKNKLFYGKDTNAHSIIEKSSKFETIDSLTLQDYFQKRNISVCDLVKMNCEGAEFEIILNTKPEFLKRIKNFIISYHNERAERYTKREMVKYLQKNNFKVICVKFDRNHGWLIAFQKPCFDRLKYYWFSKLANYLKFIKIQFRKVCFL